MVDTLTLGTTSPPTTVAFQREATSEKRPIPHPLGALVAVPLEAEASRIELAVDKARNRVDDRVAMTPCAAERPGYDVPLAFLDVLER